MRLIDADALRETLRKQSIESFTISDEYEFFIKGLICADDAIVDAPTVEAVPVRYGKWEHIGDPQEWDAYICNQCNVAQGEPWEYCPSCGARMDAE